MIIFINCTSKKDMKTIAPLPYQHAIILISILVIYCTELQAQCKLDNSAISTKEQLHYDVHFSWGILWAKAANAKITLQSTTYKGNSACKASLTAQTSGAVKKIMQVKDTLTSYVSYPNLAPLHYVKAAHEGKTDSYEEIHYEYPSSGGSKAKLTHYRNNTFRGDTILHTKSCFYDPVCMLYYVRSLKPEEIGVNNSKSVTILFTDEAFNTKITYKGKETVEINNEKINTVKYTFSIDGKAFESKKESLSLWLSDDANRIPVQIETKLKVGSLKATLRSVSGCKNACLAFPDNSKIIVK